MLICVAQPRRSAFAENRARRGTWDQHKHTIADRQGSLNGCTHQGNGSAAESAPGRRHLALCFKRMKPHEPGRPLPGLRCAWASTGAALMRSPKFQDPIRHGYRAGFRRCDLWLMCNKNSCEGNGHGFVYASGPQVQGPWGFLSTAEPETPLLTLLARPLHTGTFASNR
jgi:hypothetical protein